ncbi:hypothetical protein MCOR02_003074 [Pyricularia oryzae]|nr:hypothetical protein MCOR02_003074 [Pyricularia oryzae]
MQAPGTCTKRPDNAKSQRPHEASPYIVQNRVHSNHILSLPPWSQIAIDIINVSTQIVANSAVFLRAV